MSASEYERQLAELREQNCQSILERLPIGYVQNIKRATAFYYSPLAVDNFLNENGLSHVIRAHEVCFDFVPVGAVLMRALLGDTAWLLLPLRRPCHHRVQQ